MNREHYEPRRKNRMINEVWIFKSFSIFMNFIFLVFDSISCIISISINEASHFVRSQKPTSKLWKLRTKMWNEKLKVLKTRTIRTEIKCTFIDIFQCCDFQFVRRFNGFLNSLNLPWSMHTIEIFYMSNSWLASGVGFVWYRVIIFSIQCSVLIDQPWSNHIEHCI